MCNLLLTFDFLKNIMARYKSILQLTGSLDGLVFYKLNGIPVVRKKSGFNKKDFKTKDNYARVRENSTEFGHCSKVGKMLRRATFPFSNKSGDKFLYQSFAKLMTKIKDCDHFSDRGKRTVEIGLRTIEGKKMLREFGFGNVNSIKYFLQSFLIDEKISLKINFTTEAEQIHLISIKPNYQQYTFEKNEEILPINNTLEFSFDKHFDSDDILYFVALTKGKDILAMGFVCDER